MTQKLEELFDLPPAIKDGIIDSHPNEPGNDIETNLPILPQTLDALDKIEAALPAVKGLDASDIEMDELAKKASESFDNLMDLGMNVDSRYASEIFSVASQMLGHAITAKNAKLTKKLKMIELQLKKAKFDRDGEAGNDGIPTAHGTVLDRNELLNRVLGKTPTDTPK
jgi:hypothetical protein